MSLRERLEAAWWGRGGQALSLALTPLAALYGGLAAGRRAAYARGLLHAARVPRPVVVVGNLSVGGSGKTPLTIWIVEWLRERGFRAGVVSRGYGGRAVTGPRRVTADSDPAEVGDEPVLIARRTGAPVCVAPARAVAAAALVAEVDVIVADDGLQHYALARDVELVVVDGRRRHGNGRLLPAGPLREPLSRAARADLVIVNGGEARGEELAMHLEPGDVVALADGRRTSLAAWAGRRVHAVAGIGDPARFFATLAAAGLEVEAHPFPDHARLLPSDFAFGDQRPVLMTEKDAVKLGATSDSRLHRLEVAARLDAAHAERLGRVLLRALGARSARVLARP